MPVDQQVARIEMIEPTDNVEHRGFTRTRRSQNGHELVIAKRQAYVVERHLRKRLRNVPFANTFELQHRWASSPHRDGHVGLSPSLACNAFFLPHLTFVIHASRRIGSELEDLITCGAALAPGPALVPTLSRSRPTVVPTMLRNRSRNGSKRDFGNGLTSAPDPNEWRQSAHFRPSRHSFTAVLVQSCPKRPYFSNPHGITLSLPRRSLVTAAKKR